MIGWLEGNIVDKSQPGRLILNVNGVGYEIETSLTTFFQLEQEQGLISLSIHTVVREDAFLLYGFADPLERSLFRTLIKVNGIGPKVAINILSSVQAKDFIQIILQKDIASLNRLPGIGKKTAERLVIEMKDSLQELMASASLSFTTTKGNLKEQSAAVSALEALGYRAQEANKVVNKLDDGSKTCEQLIRQALQELSKH